ncbi:unnamed protein product [Trifolium pratense]|uniref:Uncharacterized protein n=1 Tax=Trifolium pratense TaxID=57577 RepID=A0ACB0JY16_TRIPR|nr:unnamed protein product [Trifolium pratense]
MADRIHPNTLPVSDDSQTTSSQKPTLASNTTPAPSPPPGTYIIQVPKDQTYRHPPPENAQRYANYTRRKTRRNRCCCCLCWLIGILFILLVLAAIAAGVFYLIFRPESPHYSIDGISVKGMNLNSSVISPEFDVSVKADNGNNKIGIYYETDSAVEIFYKDAVLCNGVLPVFYQPSNNVTVFQTVLKGNGIELARSDRRTLVNAVAKRNVPLSLKLRAPVKIKVGSVKTWKIRVKVDCDVTVDQLTAQAKIVNKDCNYGLDLWL